MNSELKKIVKKHFNLVDAPATETFVEETVVDVVEEIAMAEIKTADGSITLKHDGEELEVGHAIYVVTADGDIAAPDGRHDLEGGTTIKVEGGVITEVYPTAPEVQETELEDEETIIESTFDMHEELIKALSAEFKTQIEALKLDFSKQIEAVKGKVETFSAEPAAAKTITTKTNSKKVDLSFEPRDAKKKAQFERLLNMRKN